MSGSERRKADIDVSEMAEILHMQEKKLIRRLRQDGYIEKNATVRDASLLSVEKVPARGIFGFVVKRLRIRITPKGQEFLKTIYRKDDPQ